MSMPGSFCLALLDLGLPDGEGWDFLERLCTVRTTGKGGSQKGFVPPVIILTAREEEAGVIKGLDMGADDYVTKPFNATELVLRIEANIRWHKDALEFAHCCNREGVAAIGELEVHFDQYQVYLRGKPVALTTKEFEIVAFLASNPGKVFTRGQIQEYIWGEGEVDARSNSITVFVRKIREKIEENPSEPKYLLTVQRVGYKMADTLE